MPKGKQFAAVTPGQRVHLACGKEYEGTLQRVATLEEMHRKVCQVCSSLSKPELRGPRYGIYGGIEKPMPAGVERQLLRHRSG